MSRIKGKYVATVTITLEVDENRSGLLPYEEIEQTWKCGLNDWVKAVIRRDIIDDDLGKLEVTQTYCDICRVEEGVETTQPDHVADISKKVEGDCISRQAAIDAMGTWDKFGCDPNGILVWYDDNKHYVPYVRYDDMVYAIKSLPSAQPEIIHCGECIYYDPPHVENGDARYEYSEMPEEAFDVLGTGLVSMEYGINIGGRCCVDYYCKSYSDDKRVYVRENNYCGRAERRTDG